MTILDQFGKPASVGNLQKEVGPPGLVSVRTVWHQSQATGLTPERMATILRAAAVENEPLDYLTLAEEMEERDWHYRSVLQTRKLAVGGLPVTVEAVSDSDEDVKLADEITLLTKAPEFNELCYDLLDGLAKGFSLCEIIWDRQGQIKIGTDSEERWIPQYKWRDPRFFRIDRFRGEEIRLWTNDDPANGEELERYKWICHRPKLKSGIVLRNGLARLVAAAFLCKGYSLKDWLAFMEVYGVPVRVGKYQSSATEKDIETLKTAVANIASDAGAVIPDTMELEFLEVKQATGSSKKSIFEALGDWLDKQVSKAVLGQTMTADDGSSMSQARVHNDVRLDILDSDAKQISNTLNRDLVRAYIDLNHGVRNLHEYPTLKICREEPEDLKLLSEALPPFINLGLKVEASVIRDKFGLPEPEEGAEILAAPKAPEPSPGDDDDDPDADPVDDNPDDPDKNRRQPAWGW